MSEGSREKSPFDRALAALERSRSKLEQAERERREPIAIIGAGCRLPGGVVDLASFWRLLSEGADAVGVEPTLRWQGRVSANGGADGGAAMAAVADADLFDAPFFGISPREAESMDPQQRVLLEVCWEALDDAGLCLAALEDTPTGVFVGICPNDFAMRIAGASSDAYAATGRAIATASGRIAYAFGLKGPALSVDTACSSSLVAVHLACQSLRRGETELAFAAGVHITAGPETSRAMEMLGALSPTGRCRAFSNDADGYVRGEGCGVVVLKRLSDAQRDGDRILATIRGSAVNQDGRSNGLTAPSGAAQTALLRAALEQAKLAPGEVGYVEAHGTGTQLGDPIELGALASAYGTNRSLDNPLWLGSVKTNIGHLEGAAGIAGLLKAMLVLQNGQIPPNLHFAGPNPLADWSTAPIRVPVVMTHPSDLRIAGVSGFGFSGTNAHVLLERAPATPAERRSEQPPHLLCLSAKSEPALRDLALAFANQLQADRLADQCRTANAWRTPHVERLSVVGRDVAELAESLRAFARGETLPLIQRARAYAKGARGVVFVFPGHGSQWLGMGRELYQRGGRFRELVDACDAAIMKEASWSVVEQLFASQASTRLHETSIVQPALFTISVALAAHMEALGIVPDAVIGHSMGEVAAAFVAGSLSLEDAVRTICRRSAIVQRAPGGAMGLIELDSASVACKLERWPTELSIAASNGPRTTLISGRAHAVEAVLSELTASGVFCRTIRVDYASHCPLMDPLLAPLVEQLGELRPRAGRLPIYSTVLGRAVDGSELDAHYWARNLREPVLFHPMVLQALNEGHRCFIELGAHPLLLPSIDESLASSQLEGCVTAAMRRDEPQQQATLLAAAKLYVHGAALRRVERCAPVSLPAYPFQRERFPLPQSAAQGAPAGGQRENPLHLSAAISVAPEQDVWLFQASLGPSAAQVREHRVDQALVLPAASYLEMVSWAAQQLWPNTASVLSEIAFSRALAFSEDSEQRTVQLSISQLNGSLAGFSVSSRAEREAEDWTLHATGSIELGASADHETVRLVVEELKQGLRLRAGDDEIYQALRSHGLDYGEPFRRARQLWVGPNSVLCRLEGDSTGAEQAVALETYMLDASLHGVAWRSADRGAQPHVPVKLGSLRVHRRDGTPAYSYATIEQRADERGFSETISQVRLLAADGEVLIELVDLQARALRKDEPSYTPWLHAQTWRRQEAAATARAAGAVLLVVPGALANAELVEQLSAQLAEVSVIVCSEQEDLFGALQAALHARAIRAVVLLTEGVGRSATGPLELDTRGLPLALALTQAVVDAGLREVPRICFVTRGTQSVDGPPSLGALGDAALWGFAHSITAEHPELRILCVDLALVARPGEAAQLANEIVSPSPESEVALRAERWVGRLARVTRPSPAQPAAREARGPFRLEVARPGIISSLVLRECERRNPGADEVEIRVRHASINFADIMRSMGFFVDPSEQTVGLGSECVGEVVAIGERVTSCRPGQKVIALAAHCFSTHVTTRESFVVPLPDALSSEQASALPIAFMTAWQALHEVAQLRSGESILIHTATGGTGLAAVQIARSVGARIFATAGSDSKRELLRSLGVEHVFDSRRSGFGKRIAELTNGQGVDVVVNTLSGKAMLNESLASTANDGRFIELGKRDIYAGGQLPLAHFKRRIRYAAIDLAGLQRDRPDRFAHLLRTVIERAALGELRPLPVTTRPVSRAVESFQQMAGGRHTGKLVLDFDDPAARSVPSLTSPPRFRGTQLVTGGLGALGLALASWLVDNGAASLLLLGRHEPSDAARLKIRALEDRGATVLVAQVDVADRSSLARLFERLATDVSPLRGIFHLAGVLEDGLIERQTSASLQRAMAPKVIGAFNLHLLSRELPLDHFVMYSSAVSLLPSAGQANYAASNACLDALAHCRHALGLPALSVQWGPFADVGLAAASGARGARLAERGSDSIAVDDAHVLLGDLLTSQVSVIGAFPLDARRWFEFHPALRRLARFDALKTLSQTASNEGQELRQQLELLDEPRRAELVQSIVQSHAATVLRLAPSALHPDVPLQEMGLDSLTGLELRNRFEGALGLRLSATLLWTYPSARALAAYLAQRLVPNAARPDKSQLGVDEGPRAPRADSELDLLDRAQLMEELERELSFDAAAT